MMLKKALVIDDDPVIRNLIAALLRRKGFLPAQAANGEEAITLLSNSRSEESGQSEYDLILLDLMMPKLSGWDVLAHIENSMPEAVRHVVVISAMGEARLAELQKRRACGMVIPKPFDKDEFYQKIAACIRGPYDPNQFSSESGPDASNDLA